MEERKMTERIIMNHFLKSFEKHLKYEEKSRATISKYMHDVQVFMAYIGQRVVNKPKVLEYKEILGEKYEISSANSMIAALNSFFRFLEWTDCCVKQFKLQRQIFCPKEKELSRSEYTKLTITARKNGNERLNLILQTICCTGIRVSELQYITVEAVQNGEAMVRCKGKARTVFIVKDLRKRLLRYIKINKLCSGAVFVTRSGKVISRTNIWREMKSLCRDAGVTPAKVFPHNLRHLFARTFYGIEKDIAKLADVLGHSNINTTRIYIISSGKEHLRCLENMRLII